MATIAYASEACNATRHIRVAVGGNLKERLCLEKHFTNTHTYI